MRLLHTVVVGAEPYKDKTLDLDFFVEDQVRSYGPGSGITHLGSKYGSVYSQNVICITGVNATGKTTALHLLRLVVAMLTDSTGLRRLQSRGDFLKVKVIFESQGLFFLLESELRRATNVEEADDVTEGEGPFAFTKERLWQFSESKWPYRKQLKDFDAFKKASRIIKLRETFAQGRDERNPDSYLTDETMKYLSPYTSIAVPFTSEAQLPLLTGEPKSDNPVSAAAKQANMFMPSSLGFVGFAPIADPVLHVFDDSVEYCHIDESRKAHIRFVGENDEHVLDYLALDRLLSSGTRRGSRMIASATHVLETGGYLFVDEIENSINKELVRVIINLFVARKTNPHGATLVFTTHYPELLDLLNRKDNIYFFKRAELSNRVEAVKYSSSVKRGELKRSEVFSSNFIGGTAPKAVNLHAVRAYVSSRVGSSNNEE